MTKPSCCNGKTSTRRMLRLRAFGLLQDIAIVIKGGQLFKNSGSGNAAVAIEP